MKRRVAVFTVVWAYTVNALWVPGGLDGGYLYSVFAPAWHLFALGALFGVAHESLANRLPRLWVTPAVGALLFEAALALFANHSIGLWLAVPAAIATALAARAARSPKLMSLSPLPLAARGLAFYVGLGLLNQATCAPMTNTIREQSVSPDGALLLTIEESNMGALDDGSDAICIRPSFDRLGLLSHSVHNDRYKRLHFIRWTKSGAAEVEGTSSLSGDGRYLGVRANVVSPRAEDRR